VIGVLIGARHDLASIGAAVLSLLGVAAFAGAVAPWLLARLPRALDGLAARRRGMASVMALVAVLTVGQTARVSTYMGDSTRTELSVLPSIPFLVHHSCLTAYVHGARLVVEGADNVYDAENWPDLVRGDRSSAYAALYAPFDLDAFAYPPPFLLLPRALLLPLGDFGSQRAAWFALNASLLAIGLFRVAMWVGGAGQVRALLLLPIVWLGLPTMVILQIGNVHATVIVLAMLAMVAFESDRPAQGGALLAFAILSKLSPGLLVVFLLVRRQFREVLWTAAFALGLLAIAAAVFGAAPFAAFVSYQLPRLGSGEALSFLARGDSVSINMAPFGIPFKLAALGMFTGDPWKAARIVNLAFTGVVLALTVVAARREGSPRLRAMLWLTVLTLGTLRSPFAPGYVIIPAIWAFSLWAAEARTRRRVLGTAAVWALASNTPLLDPRGITMFTLAQQCLLVGVLAYFILRTPPPEPALATGS
jgi:hypothetical protein